MINLIESKREVLNFYIKIRNQIKSEEKATWTSSGSKLMKKGKEAWELKSMPGKNTMNMKDS